MQSIYIEELPYLLFNNFNKKKRLFVARINRLSTLIEIYHLFLKHVFYHLSALFFRHIGYYKRNKLIRKIFLINRVQFQEKELICDFFESLIKTSQKGSNKNNFCLLNFMKCRVIHVHRCWEYVTKCAQEYWNGERILNTKKCLPLDRFSAVEINSSKWLKTGDVAATYLDRSNFYKKHLTSIIKNIIHLENNILEFSYDGLRTDELSINLYISDIKAIGFRKKMNSKLYDGNAGKPIKNSGVSNDRLAA